MGYLETTRDYYRRAAEVPEPGLCCTTSPNWSFPGLVIPKKMLEMNYGCGSTVHPRDLGNSPAVLYVGVGGGLELLQFAYFSREPGGVIGVDPVDAMRRAARANLAAAGALNDWFREDFVRLDEGDALSLPLEDESVDVVAQNCLFNVFEERHLRKALSEAHRVLRCGGRFVFSDPITPRPLPTHLRGDERLRAMCLSGALTWELTVELLVEAGFGTLEVRARRPYRLLDAARYGLDRSILLESLEVAAFRDPVPPDGPCVFTGRTATYFGPDASFDDGAGHVLAQGVPAAVCDKTARNLRNLEREDLLVTPPNWFAEGGCC